MSWIPLLSWRWCAGLVPTCAAVVPALRTLLDDRPRTEDRRPDPEVCRTVTYGMFEVATHPGRDPGRIGHLRAHDGGDLGQPRERLAGVPTERRNPHDTAQLEPVSLLDAVDQRGHVVGVATRS